MSPEQGKKIADFMSAHPMEVVLALYALNGLLIMLLISAARAYSWLVCRNKGVHGADPE